MAGNVLRRIKYLDLAIEQGTERVPDDGRYHVTQAGEVKYSCASATIADAYLEILRDEIHAANPSLKNPAELRKKEHATGDILAARREASQRAASKASGKGGRGGRGGV